MGYFENSFEKESLSITDSYESVSMRLFYPYKDNAKIYFENLDFKSIDSNINNIIIKSSSRKCVINNTNYIKLVINQDYITIPYFFNDIINV
mgnify:CR=1 FL=1